MSIWIGRARRSVSGEVPAPPEQVRAFYVDLDNISRVHPLVQWVRSTGRVDLGDGYRQDYQVRDRIPLGPLTLPITYRASLIVPTTGAVTAHARQFPQVRLDSRVHFAAGETGTRITEELTIAAPRPLLAVTVGQAVTAHTTMLAGIAKLFAA
ncbi:polyketide cyclase / dehydrase and lipid transport [Mycolicibacterium conceptionense]|uniref:Polyketide cyclase / dehydrase and lipid transport n=2 Tax=Mycolicibacterium TaxID=1866885 RepID=A0ABR5FQI1_9MYCO|nr:MULTISPECIES: SRPBCC family protein [Mycolicibacterium]KLI07117.1 polyketide cyclase / dehydrase and lipid transport [Mycolicibacterium senegalense]KLO50201.1 polyketide cyclase / dehydrase and lipid transport [Mycolicibacterium senegalense]KMV19552.1 polyketide cyclase / dehydrase and lipid transport [Mycolicibacterium conceptionense]OBK03785.1 polyketide cyclase / dehydrase and lipid transport [Mycolicibacterium conceptionense]OMB81898.1 polyketide cyclase / dehydrase and lipid transport 